MLALHICASGKGKKGKKCILFLIPPASGPKVSPLFRMPHPDQSPSAASTAPTVPVSAIAQNPCSSKQDRVWGLSRWLYTNALTCKGDNQSIPASDSRRQTTWSPCSTDKHRFCTGCRFTGAAGIKSHLSSREELGVRLSSSPFRPHTLTVPLEPHLVSWVDGCLVKVAYAINKIRERACGWISLDFLLFSLFFLIGRHLFLLLKGENSECL